jgi:hypothetical protein
MLKTRSLASSAAIALAVSSLLAGRGVAQSRIVAIQLPPIIVQETTVPVRLTVSQQPGAELQGTVSTDLWMANCTVPSCRVAELPVINIPATTTAEWSGQVLMRAPAGRRGYMLRAQFVPADSSSTVLAAQEFYVEVEDEQSDAFRSSIYVTQNIPLESQCNQTTYVWTFERGPTNSLQMRQNYDLCTSQSINVWTDLGQQLRSAPTAAITHGIPNFAAADRVHIFYRGPDSLLRTVVWEGKPFATDAMALAGFMTSAPTAIATASNRVEVFYRGAGNSLIVRVLTIGVSWGPEITVPASLDSAPAAYTFRSGLDVVVFRGSNKHLWEVVRDRRSNPHAGWSQPWDLGGAELRSAPGISIKSSSAKVVVEYRGPDDRLWESEWDGGQWWSGATNTKLFP